jgi:hypothetical protein
VNWHACAGATVGRATVPENGVSNLVGLRPAAPLRVAPDYCGGVVLTEHRSNKIYEGTSQLPWNSRFIDIDIPCYFDPERRTWRQLRGDLCPSSPLPWIPTAFSTASS